MLKNKWITAIIVTVFMALAGYVSIGGLTMIDAIHKTRKVEKKFNEQVFERIVRKGISPKEMFTQLELKADKLNSEKTESSKIILTAEEKEIITNLDHVYWYYSYPGYSYILFLTIMPFIPLLFLVAGSNGILGSIIKLFYDSTWKNSPIKDSNYIAVIVLGFGLGIAVFGLLYSIIPSSYSLIGILFLSLFGGWFSKNFRNWIADKLPPKDIENSEKEKKAAANKA